MTQSREDIKKISEINVIFLELNEKGKDSALTILRSLGFAQSVMTQPSKQKRPREG